MKYYTNLNNLIIYLAKECLRIKNCIFFLKLLLCACSCGGHRGHWIPQSCNFMQFLTAKMHPVEGDRN